MQIYQFIVLLAKRVAFCYHTEYLYHLKSMTDLGQERWAEVLLCL